MSVQLFDIGTERVRADADGTAPVPDGADEVVCSCDAMSLPAPGGEVIVVRVAGEVDLLTVPVLQDALADSLARSPCDLIIDLSAMTFCGVRGMTVLVQTGATAARCGAGYALAAAPGQVRRALPLLWPVDELPMQFPSAAVGVLAAMATTRSGTGLSHMPRARGPRLGASGSGRAYR